jgi:endonuclease/exonuclease/phosphatase (EEP) superfamily protein YafD
MNAPAKLNFNALRQSAEGTPFMGIDHVLTRDATAVSTETVTVPDSDHRALLATVLLPRG